jgi:hypothetical protein
MIRVGAGRLVVFLILVTAGLAEAQEPPPRIGPFVLDLQGTFPRFGNDPILAQSRGLSQAELPGPGLGASLGVHAYFARLGVVTLGIGGQATIGRSRSDPASASDQSTLRPVTETFKSISPQFSMNFGNGNGWSYLSAGVGRSRWSIVPEGAEPLAADGETLTTLNYGGGARWFAKPHLAFSLDVRLYEIKNGAPQVGLPGTPHTVLLVIGAGISVK